MLLMLDPIVSEFKRPRTAPNSQQSTTALQMGKENYLCNWVEESSEGAATAVDAESPGGKSILHWRYGYLISSGPELKHELYVLSSSDLTLLTLGP